MTAKEKLNIALPPAMEIDYKVSLKKMKSTNELTA
jgi:hypothetical protein